MAPKSIHISRGVLAKQAGVNAETIRYYEKIALMPSPKRSEGGHRIYGDVELKRLCFIRRCRELGFSLDEISGLLELVDSDHYSCAEIRDVTSIHLDDVKRKIRDLKKMERTLKELISQCDGSSRPDCAIVNTLFS